MYEQTYYPVADSTALIIFNLPKGYKRAFSHTSSPNGMDVINSWQVLNDFNLSGLLLKESKGSKQMG